MATKPEEYTLEWFDLQRKNKDAGTRKPDKRINLRPHQTEGAEAIVNSYNADLPGFMLADDVGLGKTYTIIDAVNRVSAKSKKRLNILVISPLSVVPHWKHSLRSYGTTNSLWCVTNYDILKNFLKKPVTARTATKTRTQNKRHAKSGLSKVHWDIVICDESHRLKNPLSQRTRCVTRLVTTKSSGNRETPAFTIWASATAGQNPLDLSYLGSLLAVRTGSKPRDLVDYEQWCLANELGVSRGKFGKWEYIPKKGDYERVRSMLFDEFELDGKKLVAALRRKPTMIAGWPEMMRQALPAILGAKEYKSYELIWEKFVEEMKLIGKSKGKTTKNAMVAALRFRQKASILRAKATSDAIKDFITEGYRPAVSMQFYDSIDSVKKMLEPSIKVGIIDGRTKDRENVRLKFMQGKLDCVLFSVTEGISLHANSDVSGADSTPRVLLIHDLRWSALDMAQIEGRTHRDGQSALAYYMYSENTVEEKMVNAVVNKLKTMSEMLGDDTTALDSLLAECEAGLQ